MPVVARPGLWTVSLELLGEVWVGHCDVHCRMTPGRLRALNRDMDRILAWHGGPVFSPHTAEMGELHRKFLRLTGHEYAFTCPRADGLGDVDFWERPGRD